MDLLEKASIILTPTAYNNGEALCVKPSDGSGDFDFSRNSAATRVNAQGLVENVQILSSNLVQNGDFSEEGVQEVSNGSFSQEGVELVTNGSFDSDSGWTLGTGWSIANGNANSDGVSSNSSLYQNVGGVNNTIYKITGTISNYVSGTLQVGGSSNFLAVNSNGDFVHYRQWTSDSTLYLKSVNFTGSIDNVSVREVGQDWTLGTGWSIGEDKAISDGTSGNLYQSGIIVTGKQYKIQATVSDYVSGNVEVSAGAVPRGTMSANGTYTFYQTASSTSNFFIISNSFNGSITNISVKEVLQNWSVEDYGAVSASAVITPNTEGVKLEKTVSADWRSSFLVQPISYTSGSQYKITFRLKNGNLPSGGSVFVRAAYDSSSQSIVNNLALTNDWVEYTYYFVADSNSEDISFGEVNWQNSGVGQYFYIDDVSVIEITDDTNLPRINYEGFSYQDALGSEEVVNGTFATDSDWTKGTGWSISGGNATSDGSASNLDQSGTFLSGKTYKVVYDVLNYVSGDIRFRFTGTSNENGTLRNTNGTYTEYIKLANNQSVLRFPSSSFNGSIDNVSVKEYLGQEVVPDSGCGSWLFEPQSTNLITYSEDFSDSSWSKNAISATSGFTSPSGDNSAFKISGTGGSSYHNIRTSISTTNSTVSCFVKKGTLNHFEFIDTIGGTPYSVVQYNLEEVTANVNVAGVFLNPKIEDYGNGWYRCSAEATATASIHFNISKGSTDGTGLIEANDYLYIWGAQVEQQSYATSYIPTNGEANGVTRNQDVCTNGGSLASINSTEGTLYAEIAALANDTTDNRISLSYNYQNYVRIEISNSQIRFAVFNNGAYQVNGNYPVSNITDFNKVAVKYKENDFALWVNGTEVRTSTSGLTSFAAPLDHINFSNANGNNQIFKGKTKALAVFPYLSDAELTALTTI